jgi:hypothetical protein
MRFRYLLFPALAACTTTSSSPHEQGLLIDVELGAIGTDANANAYHSVSLPPHVAAPSTACGGQALGACCLEPAIAPDPTTSAPSPTTASAGTIAVRDVTTSTDVGQVSYDPTSGYGYVNSLMPLWTPGDRISLDAPGDQLPAFSLELVTAPAITGVAPALPQDTNADPMITRGADFVLRWTPAAPTATMYVNLIPYFTVDQGNPNIHCAAPDSAGQLVIPGELLAFPNETHAIAFGTYLELVRALPVESASDARAFASAQVVGYPTLTD